jgi:hypothetical protein
VWLVTHTEVLPISNSELGCVDSDIVYHNENASPESVMNECGVEAKQRFGKKSWPAEKPPLICNLAIVIIYGRDLFEVFEVLLAAIVDCAYLSGYIFNKLPYKLLSDRAVDST